MQHAPLTTPRGDHHHALALAGTLLFALALALVAATASAPTTQAMSAAPAIPAVTPPACDTYQPSQHVYDCAGLLTPAEISALELKADAVRQAGAPVVVYLQARNATYEQTLTDAANLMARWNIESTPGAKDGLVILLNLKPGDLRHGQVALYAGKTLIDGPLPQSELSRIYQDVMLPDLRTGQTASGISAGLDAVAADLRAGGPPVSAGQSVARAIGTIPYNIVAALLALLAAAMGLPRWRRARAEGRPQPVAPSALPPETMSPAVGGALITGHVGAAQMEATILDFARRGLLSMEPLTEKRAQIRLLSDGRGLTGYEQLLWQALTDQTTVEGVVPPERLPRVASGWRPATDTLRRDLIDRGWFDPERGKKRLPFILLTVAGFIMAGAGIALGALAEQAWPYIGAALSLIVGAVALISAMSIPAVAPAGREAAQAARGYLAGISALPPGATVSDALPWLVATERAGAFSQRLRMEAAQPINQFAAIYPYWLLIHAGMAPAATPTGSVAGATGAAAGGGGAGGSF